MQRRASAAARLLRRAAASAPAAAPSPVLAPPRRAAAAAAARAAGFHSASAAQLAWGRSSGYEDTPVVSLGRSGGSPHAGFAICPQQTALVIERLGKFDRVLEPGFHLLIPLVDRVAYTWSLKEEAVPVKAQTAITRDNVAIMIDGVLYVRVVDPKKASYGVENLLYAVVQLAQSAMRNELGKISLDKTFEEREALNASIVRVINEAASAWGLQCLRYEIRDIAPPRSISAAMEMQAEAERRKRAQVLDSEGERQAAINRAEGLKQSTILESEAAMLDTENRARGEAAAILARAEATARSVERLSSALVAPGGAAAAQLRVAESYLSAFGNVAKESTTMLLPSAVSDPAAMVAQAMSIYKAVGGDPAAGGSGGGGGSAARQAEAQRAVSAAPAQPQPRAAAASHEEESPALRSLLREVTAEQREEREEHAAPRRFSLQR